MVGNPHHRKPEARGANRPARRHARGLALALLPFVLLLLGARAAWAVDVPFSTAQTIDGDFDGAAALVTVDIDGDGDLNVLGAAFDGDAITWWENLARTGTTWLPHT